MTGIEARQPQMNADERRYLHSELTQQIIGAFAALIVNRSVLLQLKVVRILEPHHEAQLLNYLRATPIEIGLLLNFGPRPVVRRMAFSNDRKKISVHQR
ncbi:MAG: GxxExxY protein [Terriglobales bacterium]